MAFVSASVRVASAASCWSRRVRRATTRCSASVVMRSCSDRSHSPTSATSCSARSRSSLRRRSASPSNWRTCSSARVRRSETPVSRASSATLRIAATRSRMKSSAGGAAAAAATAAAGTRVCRRSVGSCGGLTIGGGGDRRRLHLGRRLGRRLGGGRHLGSGLVDRGVGDVPVADGGGGHRLVLTAGRDLSALGVHLGRPRKAEPRAALVGGHAFGVLLGMDPRKCCGRSTS